MTTPRKLSPKRQGPDALLLHLLQAGGSVAAQFSSPGAQQKYGQMLDGIRKYQHSSIPRIVRRHTVVWAQGPVRVLRVGGAAKTAKQPPIVLIPSLINGIDILDLMPGHSFARYVQQSGFDVYLIDWGQIYLEPGIRSLEDLLHRYLVPALEYIAGKTGQKLILAGYCMGGLLMAGTYPRVRKIVRGQIYLATPWDFHAGSPRLTTLVQQAVPHMLPMLAATPTLPNFHIQSLFALVDPSMAINKYSRFAAMVKNDPAAKIFVAVEDWLQTGRDLPRDIARVCLEDWYLNNATARGVWRVGRDRITPALLKTVPSLVVAPKRDQLVENQTAQALVKQLGRTATYHEPDCGHIGMMASPRAARDVWGAIVSWAKKLK
jgi:polyhydroxyalkanoate synthase subunit PhaC